jgi:large subunit ribosomal protein L10
MPNDKNKALVKELREKVSKAKSIVFADYKGLDANKMNELRAQMQLQDTEVVVAKNTLMKIALEEEKYDTEGLKPLLKDSTATFIAYGDPISPIKAIFDFVKKFELPKVKAGFVEKGFTTGAQVQAISTLPSKEQLIAQVLYGLKSPITGIVTVLGGSQRKLVYALSAVAKKKESN